MDDLQKYEAVNKTETLKELADVIRSFAVDGKIQGRAKIFDAEKMAKACETYSLVKHNNLTREFGIRQQAMYISFYNNY
jgi:hypothetical protein